MFLFDMCLYVHVCLNLRLPFSSGPCLASSCLKQLALFLFIGSHHCIADRTVLVLCVVTIGAT